MKTRDRLLAVDASAEDWQASVPEFSYEDVTLMRLIRVASQSITAFTDPLLRPSGLTESSYHTLIVVLANGDRGTTPSALCEQVGQNRANMTRILNVLETEGQVQVLADPHDARRRRVVITPAGRALVRSHAQAFKPIVATAFSALKPAEKKALEQILRRLVVSMDRAEQVVARQR